MVEARGEDDSAIVHRRYPVGTRTWVKPVGPRSGRGCSRSDGLTPAKNLYCKGPKTGKVDTGMAFIAVDARADNGDGLPQQTGQSQAVVVAGACIGRGRR